MKKGFKLIALAMMAVFVLAGCSKGGSDSGTISSSEKTENSSKDAFKIGVVQLAEHPALDAVREGFIEELDELKVPYEIDYKNAQGDVSVTSQITQKFVGDEVDLIFAIATPAAQAAQQATEGTDIPVLFSAVTDAVSSGLVDNNENPGGNLTGTLDESPIKEQLSMFDEIDDSIKNIGIVYNTSEENSSIQLEQAKTAAKDLDLNIVDIGVSSINDVSQSLQSKAKNLDGIYTITDNMIASSISVIADIANENDLVTVGAEEAHVEGGILVSNGISYFELGKQTGDMAKEILVDKVSPSDLPVEKAKNTEKKYNEETLKALKLDENNEVFKDAKEISAK